MQLVICHGNHFSSLCISSLPVVEVGFSPDEYSILESEGSVDLGVSVIMGSFGTAPISVRLMFETTSGTAEGEWEGE